MQKRSDLFDAILWQQSEFEKHKYPERFSDYPEIVQETLKIFYDVWKLPEGAIPTKRSKSKFDDWVLELDQLNQLCGSSDLMRRAMTIALEKYNELNKRFIIYRPLSIKPLLADAVAGIKREEERLRKLVLPVVSQTEEKPKDEDVVYVTADKFSELRRNLRDKE